MLRATVKIVTPATGEPLSLADARAHLRVDGDEEDTLISFYISAARAHIEKCTQNRLRSETVDIFMDGFPGRIELPVYPATSITSITYYGTDDTATVWASTNYQADLDARPAVIVPKYSISWPSVTLRPMQGVKVRAVVGWATVPEDLMAALRMCLASLYENRQAVVVGDTGSANAIMVPLGMDRFMQDSVLYA